MFDRLAEQLALELLPGVLDRALEAAGEVGVLARPGEVELEFGAQAQAAIVGLDLMNVHGSLNFPGTHGDCLLIGGMLPCVSFYPSPASCPSSRTDLCPLRNFFGDGVAWHKRIAGLKH